MLKVRVLENNPHRTNSYTLTAVCTPFLIDYVCPNLILVDGVLRTNLSTLATLSTDKRPIFTWIWKLRFDSKCRLLRIYLAEVLNSAYLQAKPTAGAHVSVYLYSHFTSLIVALIIPQKIGLGNCIITTCRITTADDHPKTTQPTVLAVRVSNLLAIAYARCITISGKTAAQELISKLPCASIYPAILPNVHRIIKATNAPV
ncbi:hypothetical protein ES703_45424 [subsurface metagenome]